MNMLKRFLRNDNADLQEDDEVYGDIFAMPEDLKTEMSGDEGDDVSAVDSARRENDIRPATPDKVELKLLKPKSHIEASTIADKLKEGCIVLLDVSDLAKDKAQRLVGFLAGVVYVLGGEMIKTNKSTIVVSPAGVDISGIVSEEPAEEVVETVEEYEEVVEESYEEIPADEEA
ncbi:MAG: cell division protein SepF [Ruminococcaceae bacterium]|nr:cell division protein SepF [Oscillospiraceae bacterium]